ncbi:MAG: hypothetical protein ACOH2O_11365 [Pseudomonas sp.]
MDIDDEELFGCLGIPTPLKMWKQQPALLTEKIGILRGQLRKSRRSVADLIEMQTAAEREVLRTELKAAQAKGRELSEKLSAYNSKLMMTERANSAMYLKLAELKGIKPCPVTSRS